MREAPELARIWRARPDLAAAFAGRSLASVLHRSLEAAGVVTALGEGVITDRSCSGRVSELIPPV